MQLKIILLTLAMSLGMAFSLHDFHVGLTDIRYSEKSETYQLTLKLFTDDLELGVLKYSGDTLKLGTKLEAENADMPVFEYVLKKISISHRNKPIPLSVVGRETELDVTWLYLETPKTGPLDYLSVKNSLLTEVYDDQTHVVNLTQNNTVKTTLLHAEKTEDILRP